MFILVKSLNWMQYLSTDMDYNKKELTQNEKEIMFLKKQIFELDQTIRTLFTIIVGLSKKLDIDEEDMVKIASKRTEANAYLVRVSELEQIKIKQEKENGVKGIGISTETAKTIEQLAVKDN